MQPIGDMEQLVEVERGLRDVESEIVREDDLLKATCERSETLLGGRSVRLLHRRTACPGCVGSDGDGEGSCVSPAQAD